MNGRFPNDRPLDEVPRAPVRDVSAAEAGNDVPLPDLLKDLWHNAETLLRQELALAKAELSIKMTRLKAEVVGAAVGAALMAAGALALVAALVMLLANVMPAWVAALVTAAVALIIGFVLVKKNQPSLTEVIPEHTVQSIKKDLQTLTESRQ